MKRNYRRHCVYCVKVGARTQVLGGWAHKRCIPKEPKRLRRRGSTFAGCCRGGPVGSICTGCPRKPSRISPRAPKS